MRLRPVIAMTSVARWFLLGSLISCGGIALEPPRQDDSQEAKSQDQDRDASANDGGTAGSGRDASAEWDSAESGTAEGSTETPDGNTFQDAGQSWETGGACSLPVGTLAPGCPLVLEPVCPWSNWGQGFINCEYALDPSITAAADYLPYIDVVLGDPFESSGRLLRVASEAACATTGNGWYFDPPTEPTSIRVCPSACECAQAAGQHFSVMGGCWGNAAPGVVDAQIPCPRCASVRPKSCATPSGGWSYDIVKCEFAVAPPEYPNWGIDPANTNLKYVQHAATAGVDEPWDGYLTYVPSLAYCDSVEEGWTLDMSTSPPTVHVCPSACSCAKVNGAGLMLEDGCPRYEATGL